VNNVSSLGSVTNTSGAGQIRLCRVGAEVRAYFRPDAVSSWTLVNAQQRADFGASLAVGPISFSRNSPPDFRARFDWVDYATITSMNDCENIGISLRESDVDLGLAAAPSIEADEGDEVAGAEGCACSTDSKRGGGFASAVLLLGLLGLRRRRRA
jgi:uncharacterized protein (TIGR03382 family)